MFDGHFNLISSFTDPNVTKIDPNLSAWSVQAQGDKLYVTFADLHSFNAGAVDVFDTNGHLLHHFAANGPGAGPLENPWGITQAPANFGAYSGDLLIGNVAGAGNINVFNPHTGAYLGQLDQPDGAPIAITGLWDLEFGDGTPNGGKTNQLFFDAGPNAPGVAINGLFGVIQPGGRQGGDPVPDAAVPSQPVQQTLTGPQLQPVGQQAQLQPIGQQALSTLTVTTAQASNEGSGISNDGTPTVENSRSITGNTTPVGSVAEDVDNLDALYLDRTRLIGILDGPQGS
jgi:hypothetical protein